MNYIIISIVSFFSAIFLYMYFQISSLETTVSDQEVKIQNRDQALKTVADTIITNEKIAKDEKTKAVFEATSKLKKKQVEETLNYDKSNSNGINSTHFYL